MLSNSFLFSTSSACSLSRTPWARSRSFARRAVSDASRADLRASACSIRRLASAAISSIDFLCRELSFACIACPSGECPAAREVLPPSFFCLVGVDHATGSISSTFSSFQVKSFSFWIISSLSSLTFSALSAAFACRLASSAAFACRLASASSCFFCTFSAAACCSSLMRWRTASSCSRSLASLCASSAAAALRFSSACSSFF
mmetsp:Transcript_27442/g.62068  ORF Transcript_27442/g.62068 Transcript_27442/m.62068 type:complete len:203 (+) Transcript_27442:2398-3006(+)